MHQRLLGTLLRPTSLPRMQAAGKLCGSQEAAESRSCVPLQEIEGAGAQLKHTAAVIQFEEVELEGYGPFRCSIINQPYQQWFIVCFSVGTFMRNSTHMSCSHLPV